MRKAIAIFITIIFAIGLTSCLADGPAATETDSDSESAVFYEVRFDTDGGTEIAAQRVGEGKSATRPNNPKKIKAGNTVYTFIGWYIGDEEYDFSSEVTEDITIKAKWKEEEYSDFVPKKK